MRGTTARRLIRLYLRAWRERYEEEFSALLEERPASVGDVFDVAFGAVDAWLRPQAAEGRNLVVERMRGSVLLVLWAWAFLIVAGLGFRKMTEYEDFVGAARDSVVVGVAFYAVVVGAVLALAAVVVGGLPIAFEGGQACEDSCALLRSGTRWTEGTITSSRSRCPFSAEGPSTPRAATFDPTRCARATDPTRGASKEEIPR